jgi:hypothetical protein
MNVLVLIIPPFSAGAMRHIFGTVFFKTLPRFITGPLVVGYVPVFVSIQISLQLVREFVSSNTHVGCSNENYGHTVVDAGNLHSFDNVAFVASRKVGTTIGSFDIR